MTTQSCTRRSFLRSMAIAAVAMTLPELPIGRAGAAQRQNQNPNLLIIHTDQLSCWALSIYAKQRTDTANYGKVLIKTPYIDSLAQEGAIFYNFFTNSAVCTPSHGCLVTGRYPHAHGAYKNNIELNRD
ncbi:MAG: sulfatase-like hydrolase/transferase, partial [Sedimentisphaerales bacterium]|nr:sulfatase-like hydrolase/transferase [Sedimentisphaerales bacterium]